MKILKHRLLSLIVCLTPWAALGQQVADLESSEGEVKVSPAKDPAAAFLPSLGADLFLNDTVTTLARAKARLRFIDESIISLGENTRLKISRLVFDPSKKRDAEYELEGGLAVFQVSKVILGQLFQVVTPFGIFRAKGTVFAVEVTATQARLSVLEGVVEFSDNAGVTISVSAGQQIEVTAAGATGASVTTPTLPLPAGEEGRLLGAVTSFVLPSLSVSVQLTIIDDVLSLPLTKNLDLLLRSKLLKANVVPSLLGTAGVLQKSILQPTLGLSLGLPGILSPEQSAAGLAQITGIISR